MFFLILKNDHKLLKLLIYCSLLLDVYKSDIKLLEI